jgi:hypothetical protein
MAITEITNFVTQIKRSNTLNKLLKGFFLSVSLLVGHFSYAQIELSGGIDMSYPILLNNFNNKLTYQQFGFGGHIGISYKPPETQFFPTLNFGLAPSVLPLQQFGKNVAVTHIRYLSLMLNGNLVATFRNGNSLYFLGGIGFADLKHSFVSIAGSGGEAMRIHLDSLTNESSTFPAIGLGVEYVYGESANRNLYLSLGAYCQYILLLPGRNDYYLTVRDQSAKVTNLSPSLTGRVFYPTLYISLHYLLGNNIIFWKHKDSKYL